MSIRTKYIRYLEHFGETVTVRELHESASADAVALRHDVDHDLRTALELAALEHELGCRSTYFILHTHAYCQEDWFEDACLQLQDFGHEVGLHANGVAAWFGGGTGDLRQLYSTILHTWREMGLHIEGLSVHGDSLCYTHGFSNAWSFAELRPDGDPGSKTGVNAEGTPETGHRNLAYPDNNILRRDGGEELSLWDVSMQALGLQYEATRITCDGYFTDSGGGWQRSANPLGRDLRSGRYQVLMHPTHWRGSSSFYFFLGGTDRPEVMKEIVHGTPLTGGGPCPADEKESLLARAQSEVARQDVAYAADPGPLPAYHASVFPDAEVIELDSLLDTDNLGMALRQAGIAVLPRFAHTASRLPHFEAQGFQLGVEGSPGPTTRLLRRAKFTLLAHNDVGTFACTLSRGLTGAAVEPMGGRHAHVLLGGGAWRGDHCDGGWEATLGVSYRLEVETSGAPDDTARVTLLMTDGSRVLHTKHLGYLPSGGGTESFDFRVYADAPNFNLALYVHKDSLPTKLVLKRFELWASETPTTRAHD